MSAALGFAPDWAAPPAVRAWVTERGGGTSGGAYSSLNLATHVGDAPDRVAANRARLVAGLGLPNEPVWLDQVHGTTVLDLDAAAAPPSGTADSAGTIGSAGAVGASGGADAPDGAGPARAAGPADAAVTSRPGVVCAVLTADCLPVLFCDRAARRIGVAHAGWRGLLAGVLPATVRSLGVRADDVLAWLGPAIGPAAFEVGAELRDAFLASDPAAAPCFAPNARGRWQADLYALARRSLAAAGVREVGGGGLCTHADPARFFSHRRAAPCGRMATLIWLERGARPSR